MIKSILLASAVVISAPAFAQDAPVQDTTPPVETQTPPPVDTTEPAPTDAPAGDATEPAPEPAPSPTPSPAPAPEPQTAQQSGQQPANAAQIATIVDQGFPTYDKDADGNLKAEEFGAWMVALRSATEPAFTGQSAADREWIGKALAMADADKSGSINRDELKGFLAPQASSS